MWKYCDNRISVYYIRICMKLQLENKKDIKKDMNKDVTYYAYRIT